MLVGLKRKTSRSKEISVNSFDEELCSSDRSGQPEKHIVAIQDDPEIYHEIKTLNTDNETIRERMHEDMHGLQNSRTTTFYCETIAECQRSRIDSGNREPLEPACSSTRPTTESII